METRAVVSSEFCTLKCRHWIAGRRMRMMEVTILTQSVLVQDADSCLK